ncbi:MAG: DsbC family protein [Burkholderiaceae bacterium]|nr:DsbC family protein [Burkholderiaceae bacterium]
MRFSGFFLAMVLGVMTSSSAWSQSAAVSESAAVPAPSAVVVDQAAQTSLDGVKKAFEQRFPGIEVNNVSATPVAGLYEVQIGMDVLYADAQVNYVLQGSLIDARERIDLTAAKLEKLTATSFASLPLEHAVKQVTGNGKRQIAVFEDPNCGYCKRLHAALKEIDDVTVYSFLLPILSPDSEVKARNIWCAKDQAQVWKDWMLNGKTPAEAQCDTPVEEVKALAAKLMVQGTPAIFFADDSRVNGALPLDQLKQKLDTLN